MVKVSVKHTSGKVDIKKSLDLIQKNRVYVGVPQETKGRSAGDDIDNAELLYIHTHGVRAKPMREEMQPQINEGAPYSKAYELYVQEHGSPLWQSPPRPVLEPAIKAHDKELSNGLKDAYQKAFNGDQAGFEDGLKGVGLRTQNFARDWFEDERNGWEPNAEATIKAKGSDKPLIDTGDMRKSITFVVRKDG